MSDSSSTGTFTWKRCKREKVGLVAFACIVTLCIISLLGYWITPDSTPYCNDQHLEISLQKPGFTVEMLQLLPPTPVEKRGFFATMLHGQPAPYRTIPISAYNIHHNYIEITYYGDSTQQEQFDRSALAEEPIITKKYRLGTDRYGRDVLSQLLLGSRISLSVGFVSVFIALLIGILLGAWAGYYQGRIDTIISWFINVTWSIPTLLLVIALSFALGKGFWQVFIAIGLTMWVDIARVVRGQVISIKEKEFVEAGRALGYSDLYIIIKHILPNLLGTIIVITAANFSSAILMEAGLSFLGLGVQPPMPSWGMMLKENYAYIVLDHAYLAIVPGIAISVLVFSFMLVGSALRNIMDVRG